MLLDLVYLIGIEMSLLFRIVLTYESTDAANGALSMGISLV